ncbi:MAG: nuclear transport factor 2 family protein [Polyangiaceae bacterium]|nr:nuclear transport factor 2 family protein [Polyangiaceae bacterium]
MNEDALIERAKAYVAAVESGATGAALAEHFHPDVVLTELPNRLVPGGATRDLAAILEAAERGQRAVTEQRYRIRNVIARGNQVLLEISWSARLLVQLGETPVGSTLRAEIAAILVFEGGRIREGRNYDCYPPF